MAAAKPKNDDTDKGKGKGKEPEVPPQTGRKKQPSGHKQESADYLAAEQAKKERNAQKRLDKKQEAARPREEVYDERLRNRENTTVVQEVKKPVASAKKRKALDDVINKKVKTSAKPPLPPSQPSDPRQPPQQPSKPAPAQDPAPAPPPPLRVRRFADLPIPGQESDDEPPMDEEHDLRPSFKRKSKTKPRLPQQQLPEDVFPDDRRSESGSDVSNYEDSDEENKPGPSKKRRLDTRDDSVQPDDEVFEEDDPNGDNKDEDEVMDDDNEGVNDGLSDGVHASDNEDDVVREDGEEQWVDDGHEDDEEPAESPRPRQGKSRSPGKHKARGSGSGTRKDRPKAGNYQGVSRSVLKISWGYYRALLATKNPFPSTEKADVWARRAWKYASKEVGQPNLKATRSQITLITNRGSQMRGDLKTITRPHTRSGYRFLRRKSMVGRNLALYRQLSHDYAYVHEDPSKAPEMRWCHTILFEILIDITIPAPTIALVFTVVYNCIQEWSKGYFQPIAFTQEVYEDIYKEILLDLQSLGEDNLRVFGDELWKDTSDEFQVDIANRVGTVSSLTEERRDLAREGIQTWVRRRQDGRDA